MSTAFAVRAEPELQRVKPGPVSVPGTSFPAIVRSETSKLASLRSTWALVGGSAVVIVGAGVMAANSAAATTAVNVTQNLPAATWTVLTGVFLAQILIAVMGVLAVSSEFASGSIGSTLTAAPKRLSVLGAKALIVTAIAFVTTFVACELAILISSFIYSSHGLAQPVSVLAGLGLAAIAAVYVSVVALVGVGVGAIIRNSAGAVATMLGLIFVPFVVLQLTSGAAGGHWTGLSLQLIGQTLTAGPHMNALPMLPSSAWLCLAAWAVVVSAGGALLLKFRDI